MIFVGGKTYELVEDHKNAWNADAFRERYSEVLDRYDYVVGDWGYDKLRLKGFLRENHPRATKDNSISVLQDYLQEYCNFGCAYFVLERVVRKGAGGEEKTLIGGEPSDISADEDAGQEGSAVYGQRVPFSDRKPYAWRENQSPSRAAARAAEAVAAAKGEPATQRKEQAEGARPHAHPEPRGRERNPAAGGNRPPAHRDRQASVHGSGGQTAERGFGKGPRNSSGPKGRYSRADSGGSRRDSGGPGKDGAGRQSHGNGPNHRERWSQPQRDEPKSPES